MAEPATEAGTAGRLPVTSSAREAPPHTTPSTLAAAPPTTNTNISKPLRPSRSTTNYAAERQEYRASTLPDWTNRRNDLTKRSGNPEGPVQERPARNERSRPRGAPSGVLKYRRIPAMSRSRCPVHAKAGLVLGSRSRVLSSIDRSLRLMRDRVRAIRVRSATCHFAAESPTGPRSVGGRQLRVSHRSHLRPGLKHDIVPVGIDQTPYRIQVKVGSCDESRGDFRR